MASVRLRRGGEGGVLGVAATCDAGLFWGEGLRRRRVMGGDWIERDRDGVEKICIVLAYNSSYTS